MLYLIGLGLNKNGISQEGLAAVKKCKKIYLENYTVDFPYSSGELSEKIGKKFMLADRDLVEGLALIDEAKKIDVALLVYGSRLTATTHITLLQEAKHSRVKTKVIHAGSIFDAVAETGLQLYKFGKVASMPAWKKSFEPTSFMEVVKENESIGAHSLILIDIGLSFPNAMDQLEKSAKEHKFTMEHLLVCQSLGTKKQKIRYRTLAELMEMDAKKPYCIILPGKLHFVEKEVLENFA